jgi:hypothetical protein
MPFIFWGWFFERGEGNKGTHLIIRSLDVVGSLELVGGAQDLTRLLQSVLTLAGNKETCNGGVLAEKLVLTMIQTKLVKEETRGLEGLVWAGKKENCQLSGHGYFWAKN